MPDILLINAKSWNGRPPAYLAYGILWIAGLLKENGFSVSILDRNVDDTDPREILLKEKPRVVGISCLTGPVINDAISLSRLIRTVLHDSAIVWGGIHPTIFPKQVLGQEYVDYVISGEGEFPFLELVQYILLGKGSPEKIQNLGYKINREAIFNDNRDFIDINILPEPAWGLVDIKKYIQQKFYSKAVITLNTSRGCPWRCAFCYNQVVNKRRWRAISADRIVEHMEFFESHYGIKGFQFYDDEFDVDEKRVIDMCNILIKKRKKYAFGHFSRVNHINLNRLKIEKDAGLRFIEFGVESGSDRMLKFMEKDQTVETIRNAFDLCKKAKVKAGALFMLGLPDETEEEVEQTKRLVDSLVPHQTIATVFKPYPATRLYDYCTDRNIFKLPDELERQGEIYGLGDFSINTSKVSTDKLKKIYKHFALKSIFNEVLNCISTGNITLIIYYINNKFISNLTRRLMSFFKTG